MKCKKDPILVQFWGAWGSGPHVAVGYACGYPAHAWDALLSLETVQLETSFAQTSTEKTTELQRI